MKKKLYHLILQHLLKKLKEIYKSLFYYTKLFLSQFYSTAFELYLEEKKDINTKF